jgi:hypothetical protein
MFSIGFFGCLTQRRDVRRRKASAARAADQVDEKIFAGLRVLAAVFGQSGRRRLLPNEHDRAIRLAQGQRDPLDALDLAPLDDVFVHGRRAEGLRERSRLGRCAERHSLTMLVIDSPVLVASARILVSCNGEEGRKARNGYRVFCFLRFMWRNV